MKFQYSPGLFGYGAKGSDGSSGLQGLMLYFTDYDTTNDKLIIEATIQNNEELWVSSMPGTKLAGNRVYNEGDLFINTMGRVFKITNPATGEYIQTNGKLDTDALFDTEDIITNEYTRYYNIFDQSTNYIIDDVHSSSDIDYTLYPSTIYGITPKDYARIQYVDVNNSSVNAFTLFSSAEFTTDHSKAFGIVRDIDSNLFRIGNIDETGIIRGTEIIFDVSSLKRYSSKTKSLNPQSILLGENEILSNSDINSNRLFDGVFNSEPSSFTVISTGTSTIEVSWNVADFTQSVSSIQTEIYFYDASTNNSFNPLVFHTTDVSGTIEITDLIQDNLYGCFIKLFTSGWGRRSVTRTIPCDGTTKVLYIKDPSSKTLSALNDGTIDSLNTYTVDFSTNSLTGWSVISPSWVTCTPNFGLSFSNSETFDVSVSSLVGTIIKPRSGNIEISSQAPTETISITQTSTLPPSSTLYLSFDDDGSINTGILGTNIVDISILMYAYANTVLSDNNVSSSLRYFKNGSNINTVVATSICTGGSCSGPDADTISINITNVQSSTVLNFTSLLSSDKLLPIIGDIIDASTKAVITNINKISGSDTIDSHWNAWYSHLSGGSQTNYKGSE